MVRPVVLWLMSLVLSVVALGCGDPVRTEISVTPPTVAITRGMTVDVTAIYLIDGVSQAGGSEMTWTSSLPSIAVVSGGPGGTARITGVSNGTAVMTVMGQGLQKGVLVTVTPPAATSLTLDPPAVTVAAGLTTQLTANARLADGSTEVVNHRVTWVSSAPTVATVDDTGKVTTLMPGTASITVDLDGLSAFTALTVSQPRLTALALTPVNPSVAIGLDLPLVATGTFTDGSMREVVNGLNWTTQFSAVATVSLAGVVTGQALGTTTITAAIGNLRGTTNVTVTAAQLVSIAIAPIGPTRAVGQSLDFTATGRLSDGTMANLTTMVTWSTSAAAVATISNAVGSKGHAVMVSAGSTTIGAAMGAVQNQTTLTVTPPALAQITVAPAAVAVALGRTQNFTATGVYTDGATMNLTTAVTWSTVALAIATVSNLAGSQGRVTTRALGSTMVVATMGALAGNGNVIVVGPALESLAVTPADSSLAIGAARAMHATGTFSDASTADVTGSVTWTSSVPARATITAAGIARGVAVGAVTLTAQQGAVMGSTSLTVTPIELISIAVTPATPSVVAGQTQQFTATGTYTDLSTMNVTTAATWASSAFAVATIANVAGSKGLATTVAGGTTTISATIGAVVGNTVLTSTAVTVSGYAPADGATAIRPSTPVSFIFSQPMNPGSLSSQIADGACVGSLQLSRNNFASCLAFTTTGPTMSVGDTVATLVPNTPLVALARYRLRATSSAAAASGISMTDNVTQASGFVIASDGDCAAELVISQVYGGGGNAGAPILHDFVELHNPSPTPVNLAGMALQFASAAGTVWTAQALPSVVVPPGGYYLVREAAGAGAQPALANPDFTPAAAVNLSQSDYKVALTVTTTPLAGACPLAGTLDLVGYGAASCFEGVAPIAALTSTTAGLRAAAGCTDHNLDSDFAIAAPAPRNGLTTPPAVCLCYVNETDLQSEVDYCNLQFPLVLSGAAPLVVPAVYGRVFEAGVTEPIGAAAKVRMSVGFGPGDSSPLTWTWVNATFNVSVGNDDEYQAPITLPTAGDWDFTTRATRDGTNWTMCDLDGAGANPFLRFDQFQTGAATVTN